MEHGKVIDREWMAVVEATEQRIRASDYNLTLLLIARAIKNNMVYKSSPYGSSFEDDIILRNKHDVMQNILTILKYREGNIYAGILATAQDIKDKAENGPRPEELDI